MDTPSSLSFLADLGLEFIPQASMASFTTFQLGGPCPALIICRTPNQLIEAVRKLNEYKLPFLLMGSGSNLLFSDDGVRKCVVRYESVAPLIRREGHDVIVAGSTILDSLAVYAARNGLEGLNYTTGIPGTVGGAVAGNAGAFGRQVGDVLVSAQLMDKDGRLWDADRDELAFSYRHSGLKDKGYIVVEARFRLTPSDTGKLMTEREEILALRRSKHPDIKVYPCAGSFFKNIEPTSAAGRRQAAGWFLEEAGAKELRTGGASIFPKHANIIIKNDGCTAQDVFRLSRMMVERVKEKFGLELRREVRLVGRFDGLDNDPQADFQ